jgi:hypothetical protein
MVAFSFVVTDHTTRQVRVYNEAGEVWAALNRGNCTVVALPKTPAPVIEAPEVKLLDFES